MIVYEYRGNDDYDISSSDLLNENVIDMMSLICH